MHLSTIVFDLGGVMIGWDPRNLYRKIFFDEQEMEYFLANVCNHDWNHQQDAGRTFEAGVAEVVANFPHYESQIRAYQERWVETLGEVNTEVVEMQQALLRDPRYRVLALTNWSHETFPIAQGLFPFLADFEGTLVSGVEKLAKPDLAIYELLIQRYELVPQETLFIDDSLINVQAAEMAGLQTIHFQSPAQLATAFQVYGISF